MPNSIHAARWIRQLDGQGWDLHLFPAYAQPLHGAMRSLTAYALSSERYPGLDPSVRLRGLWHTDKGAGRLKYYFSHAFPNTLIDRATWLAGIVRWLRPDVVHSLETQHAGYLTLEARRKIRGRFPCWVVSNWGSDIYYFGRFAEHKPKIRGVMEAAQYVHAECERDLQLAREFGFVGEPFSVVPCGGGFDLEQMRRFRQPGPPSTRRTIMVKGVQGPFGRALVVLRALERCKDALAGYRIVVTRASPDVTAEGKRLERATGIPIEIEAGTREDVLRFYGSSRIFISLGISEAANTSMLEAIAMGTFPIQSCTACVDEWLVDGESGFVVPPEDPDSVAEAIRRALADDELVDRAAELNARVAAERLDERVVRPQVVRRYNEIVAATSAAVHAPG